MRVDTLWNPTSGQGDDRKGISPSTLLDAVADDPSSPTLPPSLGLQLLL